MSRKAILSAVLGVLSFFFLFLTGLPAIFLGFLGLREINESDGRLLVRPRGLIGGATYDVRSLDVGILGTASGDLLMKDGIELVHAGGSRAHVIVLTAR